MASEICSVRCSKCRAKVLNVK